MVLHFGMVHFSLISSESLHLQIGPKESPQLHYQSRMSRDPELRQLHHHRLPSPELMVRGKTEPMKASNLAFRGSRGLLCQILMYLLLRMSATWHLTQSTYQMWSNLSLMRLSKLRLGLQKVALLLWSFLRRWDTKKGVAWEKMAKALRSLFELAYGQKSRDWASKQLRHQSRMLGIRM